MSYLFTSEYVSPGHPDKCADIIADSILDAYLKFDKDSRVACEVMIAGNTVTLGGEISSKIHYDKEDLENIVINTLINIGYTNDSLFTDEQCIKPRNIKVVNLLRKQSPDINQGVDKENGELGAGDQGIMFGFASEECKHNYMPYAISAAKEVCDLLYKFALNNKNYGIDIKTQVTVDYGTEDNFNNCIPLNITDLVVSIPIVEDLDYETSLKEIDEYLKNNLPDWILEKITENTKLHYNNTGRYVNHSALHDCGVTGRKLIVDTFGGYSVIGGGAQSGKDYSKVDRTGLYIGRWIAKNIVAAGLAKKCCIQLSYAIGATHPISININCYNTNTVPIESIKEYINNLNLDLKSIVNRFNLDNYLKVSYAKIAKNGQVGDNNYPWEELNLVKKI